MRKETVISILIMIVVGNILVKLLNLHNGVIILLLFIGLALSISKIVEAFSAMLHQKSKD